MEMPPPADTTAGPPPPPPFGSPRPRQLRRRPDRGPLGGVCAGVAEYFGLDPVIVRIAAVVLALSGPGVIAYGLAWIFVPAAEPGTDPAYPGAPGDRHDRGAQIFGIVLLAVAVSILWGGWWSPARRWILPFGLIALGLWLVFRRDGQDDAGTADHGPGQPAPRPSAQPAAPWDTTDTTERLTGTPAPSPQGAEPGTDATLVTPTTSMPTPSLSAPGGPVGPPPPRPLQASGPPRRPELTEAERAARRRRRMVAPVVLGALLVWAGIAALAGVSVESGLAVSLCILGLGFVLGAFVGGTKLLIVPALLVGGALVVATVVDIPLSGPVGHRSWAPQSLAELPDRYELSMGEGVLDLSELPLVDGSTLDITATVGLGHLVIEVPSDATVHVVAETSAGDVTVFGRSDSGLGVSLDRTYEGAEGGPEIDLDLQVGFGQIEVREVRSPERRSTPTGAPDPTTSPDPTTPSTSTTVLG